jgi:hypothetical protein
MGFDINGIKPNKEPTRINWKDEEEPVGSYFRNNVWWWRKMWATIGSTGEYVYREQNDVPQGSRDSEMNQDNREELIEWRNKWTAGTYNDGERFIGKWLQLVEDSIEHMLDNKDTEDMNEFLQYLDKELGEEYQFTWENVEDFQAFVVNSGGFEIW